MSSLGGQFFDQQWFVRLLIIATLLCLAMSASAQSSDANARVWEAQLVIPTYELGPPDPNPALLDWERRKWRPVYPYALLDNLTSRRVDKSYKAVYLENEYLRVTVLPELGGHLYEMFDKTTKRDVLYTNHVVKYGMVAIRGAWVSGGIEWNFPDGHTLTTISPVDYVTRTETDGSASVTVGDTERVQGMQWTVTIRLRPRRRAVETEVTLNNRRETPGRYWFWSTAAAPATDDLRFAYPMREAYPHTFWPVYSFPVEHGVDIGTYRAVTNDLSLFARNSRRDFFGIYYEQADQGVVHVADHREMAGKKTWTWGTDDAGRIWVDKLTDKDGQYVEFQAGRFETQLEHEFIAPHRVEHFTEYWYPVGGLGGAFTVATPDAAMRVAQEAGHVRVTANFTGRFDEAEFLIKAGGQTLRTEHVSLLPTKPFDATVSIPEQYAKQALVVSFVSRAGRQLISYRTDTPVDGNPDFSPARRPLTDPVVSGSAEQAYVEGLAADKKSNERAARAAYLEALRRDPGFAPAHTALGLSFYRSGEYAAAATHLEQALRRDPDAAEAHYYWGLVLRAEGHGGAAAEQFLWCARAGPCESVARFELGELALEQNELAEAVAQLTKTVELEPRDLKARTLLALATRLSGQTQAAAREIKQVVAQVPTDYLARSEEAEIMRSLGQVAEAERAQAELWRLLSREPDDVLTLVFDYAAAGQRAQAEKILEEAIKRSAQSETTISEQAKATGTYAAGVYPMLYYTLGYYYAQDGARERALAAFRNGAAATPALVFPHRVAEIAVLQAALKSEPEDGRAAYYLGNALAANNRGAEALNAWQKAAQLDPTNAVAHRNLALALWRVAGRKEEAAGEYERAIKSEPQEYHRYLELDSLLGELGQTEKRITLLANAPAEVRAHSSVVQALAAAYADARRFDDAARLLAATSFTSGEGEYAALAIYRRAHIGLARKYEQAGRHAEAAHEFLQATEYPANLGVGRPGAESLAREYVAAAKEFEAAGQKTEAERWWAKAASDPLNSPTQPFEPWSEHYYWKAVALAHTGQTAEAQKLYTRLARLADESALLEAEPSPPEGALRWTLAGAGLKALGRTAEARAALERALALEPQNELAQAQLRELKAGG